MIALPLYVYMGTSLRKLVAMVIRDQLVQFFRFG